jgi:hypothetical protein
MMAAVLEDLYELHLTVRYHSNDNNRHHATTSRRLHVSFLRVAVAWCPDQADGSLSTCCQADGSASATRLFLVGAQSWHLARPIVTTTRAILPALFFE